MAFKNIFEKCYDLEWTVVVEAVVEADINDMDEILSFIAWFLQNILSKRPSRLQSLRIIRRKLKKRCLPRKKIKMNKLPTP